MLVVPFCLSLGLWLCHSEDATHTMAVCCTADPVSSPQKVAPGGGGLKGPESYHLGPLAHLVSFPLCGRQARCTILCLLQSVHTE